MSMINDEKGITLRDYFAAAALQGYVACSYKLEHDRNDVYDPPDVGVRPDMAERAGEIEVAAEFCYRIADAMIAEREKGGAR